ncbi:hypothetical protein FEM48_ZijujUnG0101900 [Ziziphus jujuba var. spinosa]|uniref:Fe2OG dioxygenase domain-containing protein n=1 Tax=Ziziphus jujuba var. spinosa TaxID=714518 RepID=A0A978U890_ZIZJJ|nr:hypothetical protein FEM48_ZijujUnG0101900 [Ziziphus jujuba var. spinosa]
MAATAKPLLSDLVSGANHVPPNYVRPENDRPNLDEVHSFDASIPVIDLNGLHGPHRPDIINQIGLACQNYGFFQVKNHGIEEDVINKMTSVGREFFHLPESERLKSYSEDPFKTTRLCTSFNVRTEKVSSWRDYLRLHCHPLEDYMREWPSNPPSFKEDAAEYCKNGTGESWTAHGHQLLSSMSTAKVTYGLPPHDDPNVITLLLQDDVPGLQVLKDGKWVSVQPIPNTFIVNIGDQIQVISNDRYESVLHRAIVNSDKERISIPTFYCPSYDAIIGLAQNLIDDDHPAHYKSFTYREYYEKFWNRGLRTQTCLDMFKA